jgi:hypothetical protein
MTTEELTYLIKSLTPDQKGFLTKYLKHTHGEKTHIGILYKRIRSLKSYGVAQEVKVRGKEFKDSVIYYQTREKLAHSIVQCFVQREKEKVSPLGFIEKAIEFDFYDLAFSALNQEMAKAYEKEEYAYTLHLIEVHQSISKGGIQGKSIRNSELPYSHKEAYERFIQTSSLAKMLGEIRTGLRKPIATKKLLANGLEQRLAHLVLANTPRINCLNLKVKIGISLLLENMEKADSYQSALISKMEFDLAYQKVELIQELSTSIAYSLVLGRRNRACSLVMKISAIPTTNNREARLKKKALISMQILVGERYAIEEYGNEAIEDLVASEAKFEEVEYIRMLYNCSLIFFYCGDFSKSIELSMKIINSPRSKKLGFDWEPELILLLSHFEKGNEDVVDHLLPRASRIAANLENQYPSEVVKTLEGMANVPIASQKAEVIQNALRGFSELLTNPNEKRQNHSFNFPLWLLSQQKEKTIASLISSGANDKGGIDSKTQIAV